MEILKAIYGYLNGAGGYTVYRRRAPSGINFPFAILSELDDSPIDTGLAELGARSVMITVDCYASSDAVAEDMESAFRAAIDRPEGYVIESYQILSSEVSGVSDLSELEDPDNAGQTEIIRYQLEATLHYQ